MTPENDPTWMPALATIDCVQRHRGYSQKREDRRLLPTLLAAAAAGMAGTFVELGAFDGISGSNTLLLERCFNWTGLLIEANPHNFAKLKLSGRSRSKVVHSAICTGDGSAGQTIPVTTVGGVTSGDPTLFSKGFRNMWHGGKRELPTVDVPCQSLDSLMERAGLHRATFLSLDVEGAEEAVLGAVDPRRFQVIMAEAEGHEAAMDERIRSLLLAKGLLEAKWLQVSMSRVFVAPSVPRLARWDLSPVLAPHAHENEVRMGYCRPTSPNDEGDCSRGQQGSWRIGSAPSELKSAVECYKRCRVRCRSCRFVSISVRDGDCSWYASCDAKSGGFDKQRRHEQDHYTFQIR